MTRPERTQSRLEEKLPCAASALYRAGRLHVRRDDRRQHHAWRAPGPPAPDRRYREPAIRTRVHRGVAGPSAAFHRGRTRVTPAVSVSGWPGPRLPAPPAVYWCLDRATSAVNNETGRRSSAPLREGVTPLECTDLARHTSAFDGATRFRSDLGDDRGRTIEAARRLPAQDGQYAALWRVRRPAAFRAPHAAAAPRIAQQPALLAARTCMVDPSTDSMQPAAGRPSTMRGCWPPLQAASIQ